MFAQHRGSGGFEQLSQVGGGHDRPSYGLRCSHPESIAVATQSPRCASLAELVHALWRSAKQYAVDAPP
ncbi:hypothetical protein MPS_2043 [Mycobacterium pseudoshottsii JCM 15466]|nr:hypothetical protein MPS_2043 [Mycobacterium pseudoshottsii JCM 15466]